MSLIQGICFIDFFDHDTAKKFIEYILKNSKILLKSRPIIEFAIEDSRLMKKRNEKKEKNEEKETHENKKTNNKEEKQNELSQKKNSAQANIFLIKEKLAEKNVDKEKIKEMIYSIKIRGIRQRAKKLV